MHNVNPLLDWQKKTGDGSPIVPEKARARNRRKTYNTKKKNTNTKTKKKPTDSTTKAQK